MKGAWEAVVQCLLSRVLNLIIQETELLFSVALKWFHTVKSGMLELEGTYDIKTVWRYKGD